MYVIWSICVVSVSETLSVSLACHESVLLGGNLNNDELKTTPFRLLH